MAHDILQLLDMIDSRAHPGDAHSSHLSPDESFIDGSVLKNDPVFVHTLGKALLVAARVDRVLIYPFVVSGAAVEEMQSRLSPKSLLGIPFQRQAVLGVAKMAWIEGKNVTHPRLVVTKNDISIVDESFRVLMRTRFDRPWGYPIGSASPSLEALDLQLVNVCKRMVRTGCVFEQEDNQAVQDISLETALSKSWQGIGVVPKNWSDRTMVPFEPFLDVRLQDLSQIIGFVPKTGRLLFWKVRPHLFIEDSGIMDSTSNIRVMYLPDTDPDAVQIVGHSSGQCAPLRLRSERFFPQAWSGYNRLSETYEERRRLAEMADELDRNPRPDRHGVPMMGRDIGGGCMMDAAISKLFPNTPLLSKPKSPWMGGVMWCRSWEPAQKALGTEDVVPLLVIDRHHIFVDREAAAAGDFSRLYWRSERMD